MLITDEMDPTTDTKNRKIPPIQFQPFSPPSGGPCSSTHPSQVGPPSDQRLRKRSTRRGAHTLHPKSKHPISPQKAPLPFNSRYNSSSSKQPNLYFQIGFKPDSMEIRSLSPKPYIFIHENNSKKPNKFQRNFYSSSYHPNRKKKKKAGKTKTKENEKKRKSDLAPFPSDRNASGFDPSFINFIFSTQNPHPREYFTFQVISKPPNLSFFFSFYFSFFSSVFTHLLRNPMS